MWKAVSHAVSVILLVMITVAVVVFLYAFTTGYMTSSEPSPAKLGSLVKIDCVRVVRLNDGSTLIYVWVRNTDDTEVKVNALYVGYGDLYSRAVMVYGSGAQTIWGGDIWEFKPETQSIEKIVDGLIFYEDFRDGYNENDWVIIDTLEEWQGEQGSINVNPVNGLVLTISRSGTLGIEKYGLRLRNPLSVPDGVFVAEFNTTKLSGINDNYLVETYFSPYATTSNPHYLYEFAAMYINGWYPPRDIYSDATVEKQDEYGNEWDYGFSSYESSGLWIIVFNGSEDRIHIYYYGDNYNGYVTDLYGFSDNMYTQPYIYLDIGVWSGESGTFSVCFPWIKIYKNLSFTIKGLDENWRVLIIDRNGNVLGDKTVPSGKESVIFHRINDNLVYPLNAYILVIPLDNTASNMSYVIGPGETRVIVGFVKERLPATFKIKVVTSQGAEATYLVKQR